jgi:CheY-like chemotaxis protein/two-component sensor histidine kinase
VAHEINNPLAIAVANVDLVCETLTKVETRTRRGRASSTLEALDEPLRDAREALQRIRDIVRDVKLFSRPEVAATDRVDVRRIVDSSARMARNEIRHRARLVKNYEDVPLVLANESRLGQVILNLLINAAQAMDEGHVDRNEIRVSTGLAENGRVVVEVADTGCGIPREYLTRIFDPFFTTKPVGVGTGLGLAICRGIVTDLGGRMSVESEVGKGTVFRLELPAAPSSSAVVPVAKAVARASTRARVLLVDDDVALSRALGRRLATQHDVTVLSSGQEAIELVLSGERFDALILDVMMPRVGGVEVYQRLREEVPGQADRTIFVTGGAFSASARDLLEGLGNPKLEKPIDLPTLLALVEGFARDSEPPSKVPRAPRSREAIG